MTRPGFLNPGCRGGKPATNSLSYGAAWVCLRNVHMSLAYKFVVLTQGCSICYRRFVGDIIVSCACKEIELRTSDRISNLSLRTLLQRCEIRRLYGGEDSDILRHDTAQPGTWLLTFQRHVLLPSSDGGARLGPILVNFLSDTASLPR
jgi:hypothetical protein